MDEITNRMRAEKERKETKEHLRFVGTEEGRGIQKQTNKKTRVTKRKDHFEKKI